ncbi:nonribosomal peptide synthase [Trichophyton equinum CBS 127.97]|uniref:Nonribosomal peptide synthase n=1 Tax=Trichophyton equinum (strain ATCC MYA-4606 / CBS 127.97) TaxID=559882 RepID=F2Q0I0_TRIEC|nr:nonribosomal peptide synthase [Trichophyton equinum CBS 127.97]
MQSPRDSSAHWESHLTGVAPCHFPRLGSSASGPKRPMTIKVTLDQTQALKELCESNTTALPAVLRATWSLALRCYTGSEDVCFGYQDTATTAVLPVARLAVEDDTEMSRLIETAQNEYEKSLPFHGDVPSSVNGPVGHRLYNTILSFRSAAKVGTAPPSRAANMALPEDCRIRLMTKLMSGRMSIFLEWWSIDMTMEQAMGVASTVAKAFNTVTTSPSLSVGAFDPLTPLHLKQIMKWNDYPLKTVNRCIHEVIHDAAIRLPDDEAICSWDGSLSFKELDHLTSRLSHKLVELGVGPEVRVPLCFDKSKWNVVSMIAVMKAGGAFVPFDPSHPIPRLQGLVKALDASLLLCSAHHSQHLATVAETILPVDDALVKKLPSGPDAIRFTSRAKPNNAAYIIFTSGSTGEPKGTLLEHVAFCSSAAAHCVPLHVDEGSRNLQFAAHTFDASLVEILTPLMQGACVCIPSEEARLNNIVQAINDMRVTIATLTPSFVGFIEPDDVPCLEYLVLAGEAMSQSHIDTWSKINLINGFGPTETGVACAVNTKVTATTDPKDIGFPVGGHAWVVNPEDHDRLVPPGCVGELLVEGPTLARGYLNNPQKTTDAFIYDPVWARTSETGGKPRRFYKTGDLVRYNSPEGSFNYVGRKDTQVKFHGQRVELGEIEHKLNLAPNVKHGLVLLPKTGNCKGKLVAILSFSDHVTEMFSNDPKSLRLIETKKRDEYVDMVRETMAGQLPSYMVPSIWVCMESLPRLPSAKLDRKAVAKWIDAMTEEVYHEVSGAQQVEAGSTELSKPANAVEAAIQLAWSRILNIPLNRISLEQSFLSLGGDSITAMTCMGQCKKAGLGFTVQEILRSKSIRALAPCAKEVKRAVDLKEEIDVDFELQPIQQFHFTVRNDEMGHFNQSFFLKLARRTSEKSLKHAVDTLVERHSMLRSRFRQSGPNDEWRQYITNDYKSSCRFRVHSVQTKKDAEPAIADSQASLSATKGPLFAVDLFDVNAGQQLLFMTGHHLVIDLVSWRVILEDLEELLVNPSNPSLNDKSIPFQTWAKLQTEHCRDLSLSHVLPNDNIPRANFAYWGTDVKANTYGASAAEGFEIDAATTSFLLTDCHNGLRTEPVDLFVSVLIHSFTQVFTDREPPAIFNEGHGREIWDESIDIARTIGWFTTVYPIFVSNSTSKGLVDITKHVKDIRRAVPGNGRPYFATRWLTEKGREAWSHHAPMELSFNYLGQYQQLEREGALLNPVDELAGEAKEAGGIADYGIGTPRFGLFEISAVIAAGKLRFSFTFNRHMKHQNLIRQWIAHCKSSLQNASKLFMGLPFTPTLSDYPLLALNYDTLEAMITEKLPLVGVRNVQDIEDAYPCSPMQQGLLLSRSKDGAFYAVNGTYEVKPKTGTNVSAEKLAAAWELIVRRHPCLRTVFIEGLSSDGLYDQVVLRQSPFGPSRLRCAKESEVLSTFNGQGFMQYTDHTPANRFTICETSNGKIFCRLELSHAVMDGASMSIIFDDLCRAYAGELKDDTGPLFSAYVAYLQTQSLDQGLSFWKPYLDGLDPCHFPVLNDGITVKKELHNIRLEFKELAALQKFCDAQGLTLPNAIHTAWALTLRASVGTEDTCFGYLSSGRDAPVEGANSAVGPFINMLVCRVKMPGNATLLSVLEQVQKDYMDSLPHKHTSLAEVQHALKLSDTSLFNTCVSYRKLPPNKNKKPAIAFEEFAPTHDPDEYPISINIEASDEVVAIDLDHWTDSVCDEQAKNVASSFFRCLENITHNSHLEIAKLDNLSHLDYETIWKWNSRIPLTIPDCVHYVIAKQTAQRPDAPAICGFDASYTYKELDEVSTRLASYLVALGVTPETFVPTCFDKSAYTVVSMLAVLKAGGACVPLDATHPMPALETRVVDTEAQIVVASAARAAMFDDMVPYVVAVDAEFLEQLPDYGEDNGIPAEPCNPAFVIFTSGSTGKPKGVVLEHSAMVTSAEAHGSALGVGPDTRFLQFATYTFDNSLEEMFTTLMRGGCVCVPSEDDRFNDLAGAIDRLDANFMDLTPTVATFLKPADVPKIKAMAIGGEALTKKAQEIWGGSIPMHNQYGPSECSINCAHNGDAGTVEDVSNIGRSVGSVSWVVDPTDHNKLVPVGCVGELCVEGPIVARGYLNDEEKTAKSFVINPAWATRDPNPREFPTRRMYKTGDLVRYNSDGTMAFLGRKDTQVKFNGQRIELGEIEYHVKENLPEDAQSAVQLVALGGAKSLAAFIYLQPSADADSDQTILPMTPSIQSLAKELEAAVTKSLPAYMVPSSYIPVARMPMTSSGKLDRRTLSIWVKELPDDVAITYRLGGVGGRAPETEAEKILQGLWASVLSKPATSIGADDSFFRHGGDSIGAMKLVSAARAKGVALSVAKIFSSPKLCDMASTCSISSPNRSLGADPIKKEPVKRFELLPPSVSINALVDEVSSICNVDASGIHDMYPCTSLQGGLVALSSKTPGSYVAQTTFKLPADIDFDKFRASWQAVADSEVVLRTRVVFTDLLGFLQVVVNEPIEWKSVARLNDIKDENRHLPGRDGDPLVKYTIVGEGTSTPYFVWTAHHALYDGWSIPTLLERVAYCYKNPQSTSTGAEASFPDFIKYLSTIDKKASDDFWISKLEDPKATPFPALPSTSYTVQATCKCTHTAEVAKSPSRETTVASIIRAAWGLTMAFYTSCDDVIFGEILTGRDAPVPGIEDMIGPTLTSIPSRIQVNREQTVSEYLHDVQKQLAETMAYQFAGLSQIKRLGDDASTSCEFQNAIAITQDADESAFGFWEMISSGTTGNNFYTYPLNLSCTLRQSNRIDIEAYYDQTVISSWQVERLLRQFDTILRNLSLGENAQKKIGEIELVSPDEVKELEAINKNGAKFIERCIHDLIQEQAKLRPQEEAICSWDGSFTYRELDNLSTALAHHLIELGVGSDPEVFVPICFEKSAFAIISMLAIFKAGGAFVTIDPEHPISRLQGIIADVEAFLILCSPKHQELCDSVAPQALAIDLEMLQQLPKRHQPTPKVPASNAAYIIFTSGTTGTPKGTLIEHSAYCSSAAAHAPALGITAESRTLQFASYTFDACCPEILTTLIVGGCVCVPSDWERLNDISNYIRDKLVSNATLTPSFVQLMNPDDVPNLKYLALVGEAMSSAHVANWAGRLNLLNGYGPSECSVSAVINSKMDVNSNHKNIGRPLDRCWIVDPVNHDRLVPIGAVGELLIEGATLSRGYLKRDDKTKEVFIQNPKWAKQNNGASRRMYKTGDLVKYDPNGSMNLVFMGRKDTQAKVRGQRLELDEVEHHLGADNFIQHALVAVPSKGVAAKKLTAAVTFHSLTSSVDAATPLQVISSERAIQMASESRERLRKRLPAYMVPSKWVVFHKLPLMSSGKLNRRQIVTFMEKMEDSPEATPTTSDSPDTHSAKAVETAPQIDIRENLWKVWSQILNLPVEEANMNSSFLHLGGDSISAMQVMARCRSQGITASVQDIMQSKSITDLATRVKVTKSLASAPVKETKIIENGTPFRLSPIQQVYLDNAGDNWRQFNQSVLLKVTKRKSNDVISRAMDQLISLHPMLHARFQRNKNGEWRQHISSDLKGSLRLRTHSDARRGQMGSLIEQSQKALDIENGPLVAVDIFSLPGSETQMSIAIHHLVIDVVSWRIVLQDLEDLLNGASVARQDLTFQSWCELQIQNAQEDSVKRVIPATAVPPADLTYWGMAGKSNTFGEVLTEEFELEQSTTTRILDACQRQIGADLIDVLLATILLSFRQEFTDRRVPPAVFNEGHGREPWDSSCDPSSIVGWFTTMSPVYLPANADTDSNCSFIDTIRWVQDFRSRTPGKGRPYFACRQLTEAGKEAFGSHWPMEIAFNYLGQMQANSQTESLLEPVDGAGGQSVNSLSDIGPNVPRFALIEISTVIEQGILKLSFTYNKNMHRRQGIQGWFSKCQTLLESTYQPSQMQTFTHAQFPRLPLAFGSLRRISEELPSLGVQSMNDIEDAYMISPMQRGILISQLKDPEKYAYHSIFEVKSNKRGHRINLEQLEAAWQAVVRRHSSLRTVFIESVSGNNLMDQVVLKEFHARTLLREPSNEDYKAAIENLEPLDYTEKQPPHRMTFCQTPSGRVVCKLELSHAVSDGTSMMNMLNDLSAAYASTSDLGTAMPYSDFIAHLQLTSKEAGVAYWKTYLSGLEPCTLPSLAPVPPPKERTVGEYTMKLPIGSELQSFCKQEGLTQSNVLQLVWGLVLRAYTGSDEVCFGYVASGRDLPIDGIYEAVGAFINMLICRLNLTDNSVLIDTLQKTQSDYMQSISYQNCSLVEVQHELGLGDTALFNTVFTFQRRPSSDDTEDTPLSFESIGATDPNEFNMSINIAAIDSDLEIDFGYWSDTVSDAHAENIANTFKQILSDIIENGVDRPLGDVNHFGEHSYQQVRSWNAQSPKVVDKCVHEIIEEQAMLRPRSALAICAWDATFTYSELDAAASRVAAQLMNLGVGPDVYVPLCFEKSAWAIVAQYGILKAGGAFVSLDPSHPEQRLANLIEDVGADVVLCSSRLHDKIRKIAKKAVVLDSKTVQQFPKQPSQQPDNYPDPSNAAYIIFTSGTTGKPKGTVIEHAAICTGSDAHGKALLMDSSSRVLQFASYTFDASVTEILTALQVGATIYVPSDEERMNDLQDVIAKGKVNWTLLTPSVLSTLKPQKVPTLKTIVTGGEAMSEKAIKEWVGGPAVVNAYGPTEASVVASASLKVNKAGVSVDQNRSNIGTACGCRTWVVDPRNINRLMPVGAVGELLIEGRTVARGYINNPEKTSEVFISNPAFSRERRFRSIFTQRHRMYRSGDLVRYNPDGTINYISRKDTQIKLNGQRIELGEIEYHCKVNLPDQTQAGVDLIVPSDRAKKTLAVFFSVPSACSQPSTLTNTDGSPADELLLPMNDAIRTIAKTLETKLGTAIPTYMVPHLFIPMTKLPWSAAGKLDRNRLRNITQALSKESIKSFRLTGVAGKRNVSSTGLESKLQSLWESVLDLPKGSVGTGDSFFRLGGDSLAAMQLSGSARSSGISLTFANIFKHPILADMASACVVLKGGPSMEVRPFSLLKTNESIDAIKTEVSQLCRINSDLVHDIYPCSSLQEGLIALSLKQPGAYVAHNVFKLSPSLNLDHFKAAWQKAVDDLTTLRTRIVHTASSNFLQVVLKHEAISWHSARSLEELSGEAASVPPFNGGSLTKYTIVQTPRCRYFTWSIHHALYDGWSLPLILQRVESIYRGQTPEAPKSSYADFISYLSTTDEDSTKQFWTAKLADIACSKFPPLPPTKDQSETRTLSRHIVTSSVGGVTLPTIIRAAWTLVLASHTASNDVCFGEISTGRNINVPGIADIVGPTLTTIPTRIQVNPQATVANFLQEVQQDSADVVPHQHAGLQYIRRLNGDASEACDFQNLLVIQTAQGEGQEDLWEIQANGDVNNFFTYPLVIECQLSKKDVGVTIYHKEGVVSGWTVERILDQFSYVMDQLFKKAPTTRLCEVEVICPEDKETIKWWNRRKPVQVNECAHDIFNRLADTQGNKLAVVDFERQLTYHELKDLSLRFAKLLSGHGVGPEVFVPICVDRSAWTIVAMMAVLMAGGAYVPLDPLHPSSRHQEIVQESGARLAICSPGYLDRFSAFVDTAIVIDESTAMSLPSVHSLPSRAKPHNSAYVIFTSGSTGKAKGIVIEHRAFASSSAAFSVNVCMHPDSRVFQFASVSFDASVMEILTTLTIGACICIPSEKERLADIPGAISRMNVTWMFLTPSVANVIDPDATPSLKTLVCGGEAMSREVISKWADKVQLMNGYGPTETTILAVTNTKTSYEKSSLSIGHPLPSLLGWVLDPRDHNKLAPLGAMGELALEGPALAREYLNSPDKTAEGFPENPAWAAEFPVASHVIRRIHKTGDLVRYTSQGALEYFGRKDHQVKVNGQRLELGEIQSRLDSNTEVRHALVLMPKAGLCKKKLVTILSLEGLGSSRELSTGRIELFEEKPLIEKANAKVDKIQDDLSNQLPSFMVPQLWVPVKAIPLLVSGKLDRKLALKWLENLDQETFNRINPSLEEEDDSPGQSTGTTDILRGIWASVLNIDIKDVKLNKSFMSLGGDSITAMGVMSRCRKENIELSLHDVLRSKSVVHLASCVGHKVSGPQKEEVVDELFDLSPVQQLYFRSSQRQDGDSRFNQSFTLQITQTTDALTIKLALEAIVDKHSMLRSRFVRDGNTWRQKITKDTNGSFRCRAHDNARKYDIPRIIKDAQMCLDIEQGPILAAELLNTQNGEQFIFMTVHHVCVDMVSWRIILQDLEEFIGTKSLAIDKPLSFQSWCSAQTSHLKTHDTSSLLPFDVKPSNLSYWGMEGRQNTYHDAEYETFQLDKATSTLALGDSHKAFQTEPIDLFLTAIVHSFARVFQDREVPTLYNEGHGRDSWQGGPDLSRTVGWFTSICPATIPVDMQNGKDDVLDTLKRAKDIRRQIPDNGRLYFANRYSTMHASQHDDTFPMEIVVNYLGRMQQLERDDSLLQQADLITDEDEAKSAGDMGPRTIRFALFEISAIVLQDQIRFTFMFNKNMRQVQRIRRWISECKQTLRETVDAMSHSAPEPTLSDYPLLPISYEALQKLSKSVFPRAGVSSRDQVEDIYPCSPIQEGILLSQLRDPDSYVFHTSFEVTSTKGSKKIDAQKLGRAWQQVVDRHAALRTVFIDSPCRGVTFCQLVVKEVNSGAIHISSDSSNAMNKMKTIRLKDNNGKKHPQLPHQITICSKSDGGVIIKMEINHAVIDGGSVSILMADLAAAYEDRLPTGQGPLYSDYIRFIRSQSTAGEIRFWKNYLGGLKPCHLPRLSSFSGTQKQLRTTFVKFEHYPELQAMCEKQKVTMSNVMHAAWAVVLRAYVGSDDVCFGYLSAGRDAPVNGIQETIGAFINMLCCRVVFSPGASFHEIFRKVQEDYLDSLPYQRCSLAEVQHELGLAGKPLYNTAISSQNHAKSSDAVEEGILFEPLGGHDPSEYAITVNVETAKGDEGVLLRYWDNMVSEAEAQKMAASMARVLTSFITRPEQLVSDYDPTKTTNSNLSEELPQRTREEPKQAELESNLAQMSTGNLSTEQILNNNAELRKIVDSCVQDILQKMAKSGQLATKSADEILLNNSRREIGDNSKAMSTEQTLHSESIKGMEPETATPSEAWEQSDYNPKTDTDRTSMAAHINKRGRSAHIEKKLLVLWSSMLEMDEDSISGEDSFFELGGDSLTAMRLVGAARDEGLSLTVADVFRNPVFEDMVAVIRVASMMNSYADGADMDDFNAQSQAIRSAATSELYQRFSLVKAPNIDAFLQNNIIPKVGVFKGGMVDVLPVTDFQALAITGSLLESRWMLNYFYLDGNGVLDLRRLKRSFIRLVHSVDILRTVFLPSGDRFLQVVLRKMRPDFFVYETESNLDEFVAMLQQRDREQGPRLGEAFVNFTVVKEKDSNHHRIVMRLSHAQYDGVCISKIFSAIQAGYDDEPLPVMSSFASYVRSSASTITSDHYQHWKTLLKGSKMTEIVRREGPNYRRSAGATSQLKQTVLLPAIAHGNITTATVIKAAWAMVLAQLSGSPDVVFGHTISGRNTTVPGVESTVGPCLNIIPVRVQFNERWTALDLLRFVQDQQVRNMSYEALGFREITKHCTEWPDWTNFTTVVQHQFASVTGEMTLGRNTYTIGAVGTEEDFSDFSVVSSLQEGDKCEIALGFSLNSSITPIFAQKVLNMLCNTISNFMADTSMILLSPQQISKMPPQTIDETQKPYDSYFLSSQLQDLTQAEILVLSDILSRAWRQVLGEENTTSLNLESSFFDLNGDIMGLAQVAWLLEQEGFTVRVEDLIDHPTMLGQMATLCSQRSMEKEKAIEASSSQNSIEDDYDSVPNAKVEKNSWFKALGMARRMVRRNTRPS